MVTPWVHLCKSCVFNRKNGGNKAGINIQIRQNHNCISPGIPSQLPAACSQNWGSISSLKQELSHLFTLGFSPCSLNMRATEFVATLQKRRRHSPVSETSKPGPGKEVSGGGREQEWGDLQEPAACIACRKHWEGQTKAEPQRWWVPLHRHNKELHKVHSSLATHWTD